MTIAGRSTAPVNGQHLAVTDLLDRVDYARGETVAATGTGQSEAA